MENQHRRIKGYRDLAPAEVDMVNLIKEQEAAFANLWKTVLALPDTDKRWASIARTHFEEGTSALVRSVARPESQF